MSDSRAGRTGVPAPPRRARLSLEIPSVHVWSADLDAFDGAALAALLSADETARAARFRFSRHRHHFIVCRGLLRILLGRYLGMEPSRLVFAYGRAGKPSLPAPHDWLEFNVAHADHRALVAVTTIGPVGVDIECVRDVDELDAIANHFFSPREAAALREFPSADHVPGFYRCWTRKEAFIKALGDGLTRPLDEFAVTFKPAASPRIDWVADDPLAPACWTMHHLEPAPGFVGAVAMRQPQVRLETFVVAPVDVESYAFTDVPGRVHTLS